LQVAFWPRPPGVGVVTDSIHPSCDNVADRSANSEFAGLPRFRGADQASLTLPRVDTHKSARPTLPGRVPTAPPDQKISSRPSARTVMPWSPIGAGSLSSDTRTAAPPVRPSSVNLAL